MGNDSLLYAAKVAGLIIGASFNRTAKPLDRAGFALKLAGMFLLLLVSAYFEGPAKNENRFSLTISLIATTMFWFGLSYYCVSRLRDLGWQKGIAFTMVVPFVNIILPGLLLIIPQTKGAESA